MHLAIVPLVFHYSELCYPRQLLVLISPLKMCLFVNVQLLARYISGPAFRRRKFQND